MQYFYNRLNYKIIIYIFFVILNVKIIVNKTIKLIFFIMINGNF